MADAGNPFDQVFANDPGEGGDPSPAAAPSPTAIPAAITAAPGTDASAPAAPTTEPAGTNPFDEVWNQEEEPDKVSFVGAFLHHAELSVAPTAAGIYAGAAGGAVGALGGPWGAVAGALAGGAAGSTAAATAQDYLLKAAPESFKDALGIDDNTQALEEKYQPMASFLGGAVPYLMTMKPGLLPRTPLAPNASALDHVLASPVTQHIFGGAVMGGVELHNELTSGEGPQWPQLAIATGLGVFFNRPNRIGETLEGPARQLGRAITGQPSIDVPAANENAAAIPAPSPVTVAEANGANQIGEGVTAEVADGTQQRNPEAQAAAWKAESLERSVLHPEDVPASDFNAVAHKMEPELFGQWDALTQQYNDLRDHLNSLRSPSDEDIGAVSAQRDGLQQQLDEHIASLGGYEGGAQSRALRAQIRDQQSQMDQMTARRDAFAAGQGEYTPEMSAIQQQIVATDLQLRDLAPQVSAANRRAADYAGTETVEPQTSSAAEVQPETPETPETQSPGFSAQAGGPVSAEVQQQAAAIAANVTRELIAAGRPADEAEAAGKLTAARTVARAANMQGVLGNPLDLYNLEGASIRSAEAPAPTIAAPKPRGRPPKVPKPVAEADPVEAKALADSLGKTNLINRLLPTASDKEISDVIGRALSEPQIAALRKAAGVEAQPELAQSAPEVPQGELTRQALAEYLRKGGALSGAGRDLTQGALGKISIRAGQKPIITLMRDSDASTFIHESGHQWLEEMLRDAAHPSATDAIKGDMGTARKWLGMKDEQNIPTRRQHEKFARGVEQYMREGRAPSAQLASVFEKFKGWLTNIYQTVKGLGAPINDDIRGVFDRLLTSEPNRTVIAPEAERPATLAAEHEADAAQVHPAYAEPAGDRIVSERDAEIARQSPEVQNEIAEALQRNAATVEPSGTAAESGSEAGVGADGQPEVVGGSGGPGAEPAGGSDSGERGAVNEGSGAGLREGANVPAGGNADTGLREQRPEPASAAGAGAGSGNTLAPQPNDYYRADVDSKYVERDGSTLNIRRDNLNVPDDVWKAIEAIGEANGNFMDERRNVMSRSQMMDLAQELGVDGAESLVKNWTKGTAWNVEQAIAVRTLVRNLKSDIAVSSRAADASDDPVALAQFAKDFERGSMIVRALSGATAEWGRAGHAYRMLNGELDGLPVDQMLAQGAGRTLFQMKELAVLMSKADRPETIAKMLQSQKQPDFWDKLFYYWMNAINSNPITHSIYGVARVMQSALVAGPETTVSALLGAVRQSPAGERVYFGEVPAQFKAAVTAQPMALRAALAAFRTGQDPMFPHEMEDLFSTAQGITDGMKMGRPIADMAKDAAQKAPPFIQRSQAQNGPIPNLKIGGVPVPVGDAAGVPSRIVATLYSYLNAIDFSMDNARRAYRGAVDFRDADGKALVPGSDEFTAKVAMLKQDPRLVEQSKETTRDYSLTSRNNAFIQKINALRSLRIGGEHGFPIFKFADPFTVTSSNVIAKGIVQRSALGSLLSGEIRADLAGKNGRIAQDTATAKMLVGTALSLGVSTYFAMGNLTGGGPADYRQNQVWQMAGHQPYSVKIDGVWYRYDRLGVLGSLIGATADLADSAHALAVGDGKDAFALLAHGFAHSILDASPLGGLADLAGAIDHPMYEGPKYIENLVGGFVPYSSLVNQVDKITDPYARQARGLMDYIRARVPGMSNQLPPKINMWGQPVPNEWGLYAQSAAGDPVNMAMNKLGMGASMPDQTIRNNRLTPEQYQLYTQYAGRMAYDRLKTFVMSPQWQDWDAASQRNVIQAQIKGARETAAGMLMGRWPELAAHATRQKAAILTEP